MPKIEANKYGDNIDLTFSPDDGDMRCNTTGTVERYQHGQWVYMGELDGLFRDNSNHIIRIAELQSFMWERQAKDKEAQHMHSLEEQFDDLKEAGEYLRQLEQMLREAREAYTDMSYATREKLKTFKRLDVPYPEE